MTEPKANKKSPRRRKTPVSIREHAEKQARKRLPKNSWIKAKLHKPVKIIRKSASKEYNPVKMPDNKAGRVLGKRVHIIPKYIKNSWSELKLVTWPNRKTAAKLTFAVLVFAVIFSIFVQIVDLFFNRLIKVMFT
jgi:preprotein translocase SecE subunit